MPEAVYLDETYLTRVVSVKKRTCRDWEALILKRVLSQIMNLLNNAMKVSREKVGQQQALMQECD